MNFEFIATYVELQDIPSYSTNITVEGQLLKLSFLWNERIGKRVLSIKNTSDVVYLQNTILHPNEPLELNSNAVLDDLPYSVTLVKTGDANKVGNIFNWSKDFILCFSRTVDLDVKKLNVIYGVTTPSTPILPPPPPPAPTFGNWTLNQGFTILGDDIRYTGYKTNGIDTYDSFALSSIQNALVKSFLDPDLQQYSAFTTAVEQLIGSVDWVLDPANNQIRYKEPSDPSCTAKECDPTLEKVYKVYGAFGKTPQEACANAGGLWESGTFPCKKDGQQSIPSYVTNPAYDPAAEPNDKPEKTLTLEVVAAQVISNADSSVDEVLKLLSEDYINLVANNVFDSNTSKQFVKLEDLIPQLEANKVLR